MSNVETHGIKALLCAVLTAVLLLTFCACGSGSQTGSSSAESQESKGTISGKAVTDKLPTDTEISASLTYTDTLPLDYAKCFSVFHYDGGYSLVNICDGTRYLVVPEGAAVPDDLGDSITVLQQPVDSVYVAASACMDMFVKMNALDAVSLSGEEADQWYIDEAKQAMENGDIVYAGKYSTPDYELILSKNCDLALENTMILHTPDVKEQLIKTGVPVLTDYSSYEEHPLGRTEWIKVYGTITGHLDEAAAAFDEQVKECESAVSEKSTGKTVAYFSITSNGAVSVKKTTDYLPAMIRLAGGSYLPKNLSDGKKLSSTTMQMEEFYTRAHDADCLIYNGVIEGNISTIAQLEEKSPTLKNFDAVKAGHVWCTEQNIYQDSMETGTIISDIHKILTDPDGDGSDLSYFHKLQ